MLASAACSQTAADLQQSLDRSALRIHVGRPYQTLVAPPTVGPISLWEPPFGRSFSSQALADGSTLHRHLIREVGQRTTVSFGSIARSDTERMAYRLIYFRVSPQA